MSDARHEKRIASVPAHSWIGTNVSIGVGFLLISNMTALSIFCEICVRISVYVPKVMNWLAVDEVIAEISRFTFWPTLYRPTPKSLLHSSPLHSYHQAFA